MHRPKVCVAITAETTAELRERRDRVEGADLIELRIDHVSDPSAAGALGGRRTPVIFTCRASWEGGKFRGTEEERKRLLAEAQALGAEYIDIEWSAGFDDLIAAHRGQGVVISLHDFTGVPADLANRAAHMRATGAEVVKLAVTPTRLSQCLDLIPLARDAGSPTVVIGMGEAGVPSRILAARFGSAWTYCGDGVAPGQVPLNLLLEQYSFRRLSHRTALYGVVGRPVGHSISPALHNAAFRSIEADAVYLPLYAADFDDFLTFADAMGIQGVSVTAPYKTDAFQRVAESDAMGCRVGAVNTLKRRGGEWVGRNTDILGFLNPLQAMTEVGGTRVTVLGAGGAARAAAAALVSAGATVTLSARRREQAQESAQMLDVLVGDWPPDPSSWDLLVNATPVGTAPDIDASPLPHASFGGGLVYDLVYNPVETRLLRDACAAGCQTLGGLDMLIAQAQLQFEWWTGTRVPAHVMRGAALAALPDAAPRQPSTERICS